MVYKFLIARKIRIERRRMARQNVVFIDDWKRYISMSSILQELQMTRIDVYRMLQSFCSMQRLIPRGRIFVHATRITRSESGILELPFRESRINFPNRPFPFHILRYDTRYFPSNRLINVPQDFLIDHCGNETFSRTCYITRIKL